MKSLLRLTVALALLVPAGLMVAQPAGAGLGAASCSGNAGTMKINPGLTLTTKRSQTYSMTNVALTCTGGYVDAGTVSGKFQSSTEVNCQNAVGTKNGGYATFTWTAPANMGTTTAKLNFKITGTTTTTTTGTFNGVVTTTGSGLFKNDTVTGSITLGKGLKPTSQGGACSVTKQLGSMPITAITLNIT